MTYLYEYDGYLRELFIQDGVDAKASDGRKILASDCFSFDETQDGLFHLYCTNKDGSIFRYLCQYQKYAVTHRRML